MSYSIASLWVPALLTAFFAACSEPKVTKVEPVMERPVLTPRVAKETSESKVPVLWPAELGSRAILVTEPLFYSVTGAIDTTLPLGQSSRATITVQGTREIHNNEPVETKFNMKLRGRDALYTRNEEIATTTWIENGVVYSVDVECSQIEDERCRGDAFVKSVSENLRPAAGAQ
jgi:hypothetical protein